MKSLAKKHSLVLGKNPKYSIFYSFNTNIFRTNDVIEYLKKQKADINRQHESNEYRAGMTIKLYENGEMLPYEEWFKLPNFINHIKEIGETPPFYNRSN